MTAQMVDKDARLIVSQASQPDKALGSFDRKRRALARKVTVAILVGSAALGAAQLNGVSAAPSSAADLSAKPTLGDSVSEARYAWWLFIQAMAPKEGSGGPLAFENWTEQCQLGTIGCSNGTGGSAPSKVRKLHGSPLRAASATANGIPMADCSAMNSTGFPGYPAPPNVKVNQSGQAPQSVFCEEVYVNSAEAAFVSTEGLSTLIGQQAYGKRHGGAVTFPWEAVEIKVDWVTPSSFNNNDTFKCPDATGKLYTETINGTCYAMVGLHISSKVLPNWLWATFEPNSNVTNPNRCDPNLYSTCFDPWGTTSTQPYAKGQPVPPQSPQLQQAMSAAGLNKAFSNYYLTGVQTQFVSNGQPVSLGSSFIEFNANVSPGQASCITCHRYAYFDGQQPTNANGQPVPGPEDNFGGPPPGWSAVGYACPQNPHVNCTPVVKPSTSQDFSWMLGLMPYTR